MFYVIKTCSLWCWWKWWGLGNLSSQFLLNLLFYCAVTGISLESLSGIEGKPSSALSSCRFLLFLSQQGLNRVGKASQVGHDGVRRKDWHDYEAIRRDLSRSGRSHTMAGRCVRFQSCSGRICTCSVQLRCHVVFICYNNQVRFIFLWAKIQKQCTLVKFLHP